jgi:hypothetical protein
VLGAMPASLEAMTPSPAWMYVAASPAPSTATSVSRQAGGYVVVNVLSAPYRVPALLIAITR